MLYNVFSYTKFQVDVEFNLGAFNLFLTPQEVHLLFTLMNGFMKPSNFAMFTYMYINISIN